jgi:hypothetical protein
MKLAPTALILLIAAAHHGAAQMLMPADPNCDYTKINPLFDDVNAACSADQAAGRCSATCAAAMAPAMLGECKLTMESIIDQSEQGGSPDGLAQTLHTEWELCTNVDSVELAANLSLAAGCGGTPPPPLPVAGNGHRRTQTVAEQQRSNVAMLAAFAAGNGSVCAMIAEASAVELHAEPPPPCEDDVNYVMDMISYSATDIHGYPIRCSASEAIAARRSGASECYGRREIHHTEVCSDFALPSTSCRNRATNAAGVLAADACPISCGTGCFLTYDDCWNSPCLNGGTCTDGLGHPVCACAAGWSGVLCEVRAGCWNSPCLNGGICTSADPANVLANALANGSYTCACGMSWAGPSCEAECAGHGSIAGGSCVCDAGYTGTDCSLTTAPCADDEHFRGGAYPDDEDWHRNTDRDPCSSRTRCDGDDDGTSFHRDDDGAVDWSSTGHAMTIAVSAADACPISCGSGCALTYDDCWNSPCLNGGTCTDGLSHPVCACGSWSGALCEVECAGHGSIVGESCVCDVGWIGADCSLVPLPTGFDEAYTLTGCADPAHCGTFRRVAARCTSDPDGYSPCLNGGTGGYMERTGNTDLSLCDGVPAYQKGGSDGPVLYRWERGDGRTWWSVGASSKLETCDGAHYASIYLTSSDNYPSGPPTEPGYSNELTEPGYSNGLNEHGGTGWIDQDIPYPYCTSDCGIAIAAGGR